VNLNPFIGHWNTDDADLADFREIKIDEKLWIGIMRAYQVVRIIPFQISISVSNPWVLRTAVSPQDCPNIPSHKPGGESTFYPALFRNNLRRWRKTILVLIPSTF
jgi:hypothetical protein